MRKRPRRRPSGLGGPWEKHEGDFVAAMDDHKRLMSELHSVLGDVGRGDAKTKNILCASAMQRLLDARFKLGMAAVHMEDAGMFGKEGAVYGKQEREALKLWAKFSTKCMRQRR